MKKKYLMMGLMALAMAAQAQTIDECQHAAEQNYPLIRQYDLIAKTTDLTVKNIQKAWLPQIGTYAQATYQSDVASWPDGMKQTFGQMGVNMRGLANDQYKVGIDLQQTIYDGGAISSQSKVAREQGKVEQAQTAVQLYKVRKRVNEMFFALLMLDEQIKINDDVQSLLLSNEQKLASMVKGGTASVSDLENVKAERLNAEQQNTSMKSERTMLRQLLGTFCGIEIGKLEKPAVIGAYSSKNNRPELHLYDAQLQLADAQERALSAQVLPRLGLFAQGFYGYPGLNMFDDMINHNWSLNAMIGVKLSWNIGALYTRRNDRAKLQARRELTENTRSVFLFNNRLEQMQQQENIDRYRKLMQTDEAIIALRGNVRKAAESKLAHGIIDINSLLREINSENVAKIQQTIHEIDMLREMYNQKYTTNE